MTKIIEALKALRGGSNDDADGGAILGLEWLEQSRSKTKKCIIAPRLTRRAVVFAVQEKAELIITIIPPTFSRWNRQKIERVNLELLKILMTNSIAVYSIGNKWLTAENGGFDYLLKLLGFKYSTRFSLRGGTGQEGGKEKRIDGRLGEREQTLSLKELLGILYETVKEEIFFWGYKRKPIRRVAVFSEIRDEEPIYEIANNPKIDAIILGELSYEALLAAHLNKLTICIIGKRSLENIILARIRRELQEQIATIRPELVTMKQEEIRHSYTNENS